MDRGKFMAGQDRQTVRAGKGGRIGLGQMVTVYGGSGFVGRNVVRVLAQQGYRIRIAVRRPHLAGHLQPLGDVGQIHTIQANLRDRASVERAAIGADAIINLVGILTETGKQRFETIQHFGARTVAEAAKKEGITRLIQMSALGADPRSKSHYARSKARGEMDVRNQIESAIILRPSIIFGPEDDFFNRFAAMAAISPVLPLIGGGRTRFQPVYVGDVAQAVAAALAGRAGPGATYELGGPQIYSFRELLEMVLAYTDRKRFLLPLPTLIAKLLALLAKPLPGPPPITIDQINLLKTDNVVSAEAIKAGRTLEGLGLTPQRVEAIVHAYLEQYRRRGQFANTIRSGLI